MCRSLAEGGQRCAAHTRPAYQTAAFGTPDWDRAAAQYASTPTGRMELMSSMAAAEAADDVQSAVAFDAALREGERLRERATMTAEAVTSGSGVASVPEAESAGQVLDETIPGYGTDGYYDDEPHDDYVWEPSPTWSPSMSQHSWNRDDPSFAGCRPDMTESEFIDQVCDNEGVSREQFEVVLAEHMAREQTRLVSASGEARAVGFGVGDGGGARTTEAAARLSFAGYTATLSPQEIRNLAREAARREQATAKANEAALSAPAEDQTAAVRRGRMRVRDLPDDPARLAGMAGHEDPKIRALVAQHPSTPVAVLERFATGVSTPERAAVAANPSLPPALIEALSRHSAVTVRARASRNPNLSPTRLSDMASDGSDRVRGGVAANPATPEQVHLRLSRDPAPGVRARAARRANMPEEMINRLASDEHKQVRASLYGNSTISDGRLSAGLTDPEQSVRTAVAKNRTLAPGLLRGSLSRDRAPGVRAGVASNPNTPVPTITRLATDPDAWVRRNVAWNASTPALVLYGLSHDADRGVRESALQRMNGEPQATGHRA